MPAHLKDLPQLPAHLKDLPQHKCQSCGKKATKELYNTKNAPLGRYCARCGQRALREHKARVGER